MPRHRRALTQLGGRVRTEGDAAIGAVLARAWRRAGDDPPDRLTHGFHSWPARMHPSIPGTLIEALDGRTVLDPFCGGGTVIVEARAAGRRSIGVDLDPLSALLVDVKTDVRTEAQRARFLEVASLVAAASEHRVRERVPIRVDLPKTETRWYGPHVLKELGGLLEEIRAVDQPHDRRALAMVFSAIVVKVSKQKSDTAEEEAPARIRKGLATELFHRKATELAERWAALAERATGPAPLLRRGDARELPRILGSRKVDLIVTSPPYGGTYDYATHHARRAAWLGLPLRDLRKAEIGARRRLSRAGGAEEWEGEVDAMLASMAAVLRRDGRAVLVMGDGEVARRRVDVLPQLARLAPRHGLRLEASASQPRRDWGGRSPREEHLVALLRG